MKTRKILIGLLLVAMAGGLLSGCGKKEKLYKIGINQLVRHSALDASYQGFVDALEDAGYIDGENITIDYQNAQNDQSTLNTIATKFVNDGSDLILAIATPSAQAVANATKDIPILITAVTDPAGSGLVVSNNAPGGNVSGTSDLTPVKQQIELITKLVPDARRIAILYSSSETNSKIQVEMAIEAAQELNLEVIEATVSNTNDIEQVVQSLIGKVDAIYAPTDNTIASGMPTVAMVANPNGIPIICGEEGMVDKGGLATYGIDYYKLGWLTGQQAVKIIKGEATTDTMPIEYLPDDEFSLTVNEEVAAQLGIEIPQELFPKQ
jgi:putative ABC transport system substrate-binding protein